MDKYYTPDISDLHVGYECELFWNQDMLPENFWDSITIGDKGTEDIDWRIRIEKGEIRTPYLTKEQIEKEGWKYEGAKDYYLFGYDINQGFHNAMEKGDYIIQGRSLFGSQHYLKIFDKSDQEGAYSIFAGRCPSINEFRKICKLIGV